jgi:hypothetical protein
VAKISILVRPIAPLLLALLVTLWVWLPFFRSDGVNDLFKDWSYRANYMAYAVHAVSDAHQMPYWATLPEYEQLRVKGNHGFFSNPETEVFSPYLPLYRLFPFLTACKIAIALHLLAGVIGVWLLCARGFALRDPSGIAIVSALLLSSGFFVPHVLIGHTQFASYCYFPLAFYCYLRATTLDAGAVAGAAAQRGRVLFGLGAALVLVLGVYEGCLHLLIHFWMFLTGFSALSLLLTWERRRAILGGFGLVLAAFALLGAYKLVPMLFEYGKYQADYLIRYESRSELTQLLLAPRYWEVPGVDHEKALYLGWLGTAFLLAGYLQWRRQAWPILLCSILLLTLCFAPYIEELRRLPIMKTQGVFTRFRGTFLFAGLCLLALQLGGVERWLRARSSRAPLLALRVLLGVCCAYLTYDLGRSAAANVAQFSRDQVVLPTARLEAPPFVALAAPPPTAPPGTVERLWVHVNAFEYAYTGAASPEHPALLYAPDLKVEQVGKKLRLTGEGTLTEHDGCMAVRVTQPGARFVLSYHPSYFHYGMCLSLLTLIAAGTYLVWPFARAHWRTLRA